VARVSKYTADGKFIKSWGGYGYGPGEFRGAHSLAMDSQGRLFVADRGNRRLQIFDQEGKHLETWYQFSRVSGPYIERRAIRSTPSIPSPTTTTIPAGAKACA
jgi:hypothetical protein